MLSWCGGASVGGGVAVYFEGEGGAGDAERKRAEALVKRALLRGAPEAAEYVVGLVGDEGAPAVMRLKAAEMVLDRVMGKPRQEMVVGGMDGRPIVFDGALARLGDGGERAALAAGGVVRMLGGGEKEAVEAVAEALEPTRMVIGG